MDASAHEVGSGQDEAPASRSPRFLGFLGSMTLRSPAVAVITLTACLAVLTGVIVVSKLTDQMAREADARLERHAAEQAASLEGLMASASRDIRLARQNDVFEKALANTQGQLLPADRRFVESAITYLGERYRVDEICVVRADGLEAARWVSGKGVAPVVDLSPDERQNNPAVVPTIPLSDDAFYQTAPYISPDSRRWVIGIATPIVLPSGTHAGILHFEIPIQRFVEQLAQVSFGGSGYALLLDRSGRMLSGPQLAEFRSSQGFSADPDTAEFPFAAAAGSASWKEAIKAALTGGSGNVGFEEQGTSFRASYEAEAASDRVIVAVSPSSEIYADVDRARLNLIASVGPLILLIVLVSGWFSYRLSGSNRRLAGVNQRLQISNELLATVNQASSELAAIVRAGDDAMMSVELDGTIATWNDGADHMYGLRSTDVVGSSVARLVHPDRAAELSQLLATMATGEPIQRHESIHVTADGTSFDASVTLSPIRAEDGRVNRAALVVRDISDRKRLEEELAHQALHDGLTGLPNRVLFQDRLRHSLARTRRPRAADGAYQAVLFVDLDNFKLINDTMGHKTGDQLLVAVAERVSESLRAGDTAARLGGDEFTILLENVKEGEARSVADRLLKRLREPFILDGHQAVVSASIGIALSEAGAELAEDLLRSADTALYEAKSNGKGRHETFHPEMTARVWRRLELETDLRRALEAQELIVYYQPIVDLESGEIRELEALVRWQHPERGLLPPGEFIPLAEETGLIVEIGRVVLRAACEQLVAWDKLIPTPVKLRMSVNVSPRELREPTFVDGVLAALADSGLAATRLTIEITETVTLDQAGQGIDALSALHELGVHLSIDDFGTGYSSLGYFRSIALDALKIDRLFIEGLGRERRDSAIVAAAIAFGSALGLEVTAEGIETEEQAEILRTLHCPLAQGYLFCPPRDADAISDILKRGGSLRHGLAVHRPDAA